MFSESSNTVLAVDDFHPVFNENLNHAGIQLHYKPDFDLQKDKALLNDYPIIAIRSKFFFGAELINSLPILTCIARGGAGMDNIDEAAAVSKGITLLNAPEGNRDAVSEHAIGLMLALARNIKKSSSETSKLIWEREGNRGIEIGSSTIGIIGFGNAGSTLARKLSGFGCKILAYDKYLNFSSPYAGNVSFEEVLKQSDIISFHVPLTRETSSYLNADMIARMKDGVTIINTSRGGICNTADVWNGIKSGKIKGFASDVLENERMSELSAEEARLITDMSSVNQVLITPHIAGWTTESYRRIAEVLSNKIIEFTTKVKNNRMKVD